MGFPVGAAVKTRQVIVGEGEILCKADHDFSRFNLVPSVNLKVDIPPSIEGSFYQGEATVTIKCAIVQPSSAARHVAEAQRALPNPSASHADQIPLCCPFHRPPTSPLSLCASEPIRLKYHDGGCDRNDSHGSVVLCNIAEFLLNDLDYMVSMRCIPHQSYKDPAEHVMAALNLGQQCLALARSKMSDEEEDLIKNCNSMRQIRAVTAAQSDSRSLTKALLLSTLESRQALGEIYENCIFSGKHLKVHAPATDQEILRVQQVCAICVRRSGKPS